MRMVAWEGEDGTRSRGSYIFMLWSSPKDEMYGTVYTGGEDVLRR